MYKEIELTAKNEEEALQEASIKLQIGKVYLSALTTDNIKKEEKNYFVSIKDGFNVILETKKYIEGIFTEFNIIPRMEIKQETDKSYIIKILTDSNSAFFADKEGRNIGALGVLVQEFMSQFFTEYIKCNLDFNNYYEKKASPILGVAIRTAKEVLKYKEDRKLRPMNNYYRKLVHDQLSSWKHIKTVSEGENPNRYVVIKYTA
jgi:spoIIIJ-associated protein